MVLDVNKFHLQALNNPIYYNSERTSLLRCDTLLTTREIASIPRLAYSNEWSGARVCDAIPSVSGACTPCHIHPTTFDILGRCYFTPRCRGEAAFLSLLSLLIYVVRPFPIQSYRHRKHCVRFGVHCKGAIDSPCIVSDVSYLVILRLPEQR